LEHLDGQAVVAKLIC